MIGQDIDLQLTVVQDHRDFLTFYIDHLSSLTLVFALSYTNQVSRLKVLRHMSDIHLEQINSWDVDRLKSDHAIVDLNYYASYASQLTFVHANLVAFHVDCLAALHQSLFDHPLDFGIFVFTLVIIVVFCPRVVNDCLEILQLFVGRLYRGT